MGCPGIDEALQTTSTVLDLLDELNADGVTVLVITHDESVAARGNRTLRISDGMLTELTRA